MEKVSDNGKRAKYGTTRDAKNLRNMVFSARMRDDTGCGEFAERGIFHKSCMP